jgi:hypothetical protein
MVDALYLSETEIGKRVLGRTRAHEWPVLAKVLEERGLPPINPVTGMRYWPAVVRWFDRYENVVPLGSPPAPPLRRLGGLLPGEKPCPPGRGRKKTLLPSPSQVTTQGPQVVKKIEVKPVGRPSES